MAHDDLKRRFFLDVYACGAVEIRERGKRAKGSLPVFSTDTREQAVQLQVLRCRLERDNKTYRLNDPPKDADDCFPGGRIAEMFRGDYARMLARAS